MMIIETVRGERILMEDDSEAWRQAMRRLGWIPHYGYSVAWAVVKHPKQAQATLWSESRIVAEYLGISATSLYNIAKRRAWQERKDLLRRFQGGVLGPHATGYAYRRMSDGRPTERSWRRLRDLWHDQIRQAEEAQRDRQTWGRVLGADEVPF